MDANELSLKNETLSVHWSALSYQDRCLRLTRTLSSRKPGFRVPCSMCDAITPSDRWSQHVVHFLGHHTTESDVKEEIFAEVGIPNLPKYNNAWQKSRDDLAKRNNTFHGSVALSSSEDCGSSLSTSSLPSCSTKMIECRPIFPCSSQADDNNGTWNVSPRSAPCKPISSQSASSSSIIACNESVNLKVSPNQDLLSDDSSPSNIASAGLDSSDSLDEEISLESRHESDSPEPLNFTSTLHNNSSIIMPNPIYQGIPSSHASPATEIIIKTEDPSDTAIPISCSLSSSSAIPRKSCAVITGSHIVPRSGPLEITSSFSSPSSSSSTLSSSNFSNAVASTNHLESRREAPSLAQDTESSVQVTTEGTAVPHPPTMKRKRGRPRKYFPAPGTSANDASADGTMIRRKRGRPRKYPPDLLNRKPVKPKNAEVSLRYNERGEPIAVRRRGRPRKCDTTRNPPPTSSITIQSFTITSQPKNSSFQEPCIQTRFMTEKARELFLKQCQVSFHSDRSKKQQRLEEKRRRLNELLRMEKKLQSQLASELDSDLISGTDDEEESNNDLSSSDEGDDITTETEASPSTALNQLDNMNPENESPSSLNLVPTTLPGIFFTNPNISIEVLPARKNSTRNARRHS